MLMPNQSAIPEVFLNYYAEQDAWARANAASNSSAFWTAFALLQAQFDGMVAGYNSAAPPAANLSAFNIQTINTVGDWWDLVPALMPSLAPDWDSMSPAQVIDTINRASHCSALIKVDGNYSDLYMAHST